VKFEEAPPKKGTATYAGKGKKAPPVVSEESEDTEDPSEPESPPKVSKGKKKPVAAASGAAAKGKGKDVFSAFDEEFESPQQGKGKGKPKKVPEESQPEEDEPVAPTKRNGKGRGATKMPVDEENNPPAPSKGKKQPPKEDAFGLFEEAPSQPEAPVSPDDLLMGSPTEETGSGSPQPRRGSKSDIMKLFAAPAAPSVPQQQMGPVAGPASMYPQYAAIPAMHLGYPSAYPQYPMYQQAAQSMYPQYAYQQQQYPQYQQAAPAASSFPLVQSAKPAAQRQGSKPQEAPNAFSGLDQLNMF